MRSGPAPEPNALRRDRPSDTNTWTTLPFEGRRGRIPAWPLSRPASRAERALWNRIWRTPQSVQWEKDRMFERVARYVCKQIESDEPGSPAAKATIARQMADDLGLTYAGMNRLRWRVSRDEVAELRAQHARSAPASTPRQSSRERLRRVDGGRG